MDFSSLKPLLEKEMLHPIRALNYIIDSYRDYLTTEFRARDPQLRRSKTDEYAMLRLTASGVEQ